MKGKILVIEDDEIWQAKLKKCIEAADFYVEIVNDLEAALMKIRKEMFHFITIDMQLDESNTVAAEFEGWRILEIVKKLRIQDMTPVMVITGFGLEYEELRRSKKPENLFFMEKGEFDRKKLIEIIERSVKSRDLRFKDDHRGD